jgi:hypothetical protein
MYNRRSLIARIAEQHMAMFHTKEEGGTQEFNEWKEKQPEAFQEEWDENTDKYKDVVKNRAKELAKQARFEEGDTAGWKAWMETQPEEFQQKWQDMNDEYGDVVKDRAKEMSKKANFSMPSPDCHLVALHIAKILQQEFTNLAWSEWEEETHSVHGMSLSGQPILISITFPGNKADAKLFFNHEIMSSAQAPCIGNPESTAKILMTTFAQFLKSI